MNLKNTSLSFACYRLLALALPLSVTAILNVLSNLVAVFFVAKLGKTVLAATALAFATYISVSTIVSTSLYAVSILISHAIGQDDDDITTGQWVKSGAWFATFLSLPCTFLLWHADTILFLCRQNPQLIALTKDYFFYAALALWPTLINGVYAQFFAGIGRPRFILYSTGLRLPFTIGLSYCLILGKGGLPALGLPGVMAAALVTQSLYCVCLTLYLYHRKNYQRYQLFFELHKVNFAQCKQILSIGLPIGLQFGGELTVMTVITYLTGFFGVKALAAAQISSQYSLIVVMLMLGMAQAMAVLTSEAHGKQNTHLIKQYIGSGLVLLTLLFAGINALFILLPNPLINLYLPLADSHDAALRHLARLFLLVAGLSLYVDAIRHLLSSTLRGMHESMVPMKVGLFCLWCVGLPAAIFIGFTLSGGAVGLRLGFMLGLICSVIILSRLIYCRLSTATV